MAELLTASKEQHSGSLLEPPLSLEMPKLSPTLLKWLDSDKAHSLTPGSTTIASPMAFTMDNESVMSLESRESSASPDTEVRLRGCREAELSTASALEQAWHTAAPGSTKDRPPVPGYVAPDIMPPDVPPPPDMPPASLPDASDRAQPLCPFLLFSEAPPSPQDAMLQQHFASVVVGPSNASLAMSREQAFGQPHGFLSTQYSTSFPACSVLSEYDEEISQTLAVLDLLRIGPRVPPLPPSGCYGGFFMSSAISEGLGVEAAEAAEAAAREFGEVPVKVLLPWYPAHASITMFDKTKPAKITPAF